MVIARASRYTGDAPPDAVARRAVVLVAMVRRQAVLRGGVVGSVDVAVRREEPLYIVAADERMAINIVADLVRVLARLAVLHADARVLLAKVGVSSVDL